MENTADFVESKIPRVKSATRNIPSQVLRFQKYIINSRTNLDDATKSNQLTDNIKLVQVNQFDSVSSVLYAILKKVSLNPKK